MSTLRGCLGERHEQATALHRSSDPAGTFTDPTGRPWEIVPPRAPRLTKTGRLSMTGIRYRDVSPDQSFTGRPISTSRLADVIHCELGLANRRGSLV